MDVTTTASGGYRFRKDAGVSECRDLSGEFCWDRAVNGRGRSVSADSHGVADCTGQADSICTS